MREVEIDVGIGVLLQLLEGRSPRRAQDLVDLGDLVELVCAGKERREREHLRCAGMRVSTSVARAGLYQRCSA